MKLGSRVRLPTRHTSQLRMSRECHSFGLSSLNRNSAREQPPGAVCVCTCPACSRPYRPRGLCVCVCEALLCLARSKVTGCEYLGSLELQVQRSCGKADPGWWLFGAFWTGPPRTCPESWPRLPVIPLFSEGEGIKRHRLPVIGHKDEKRSIGSIVSAAAVTLQGDRGAALTVVSIVYRTELPSLRCTRGWYDAVCQPYLNPKNF